MYHFRRFPHSLHISFFTQKPEVFDLRPDTEPKMSSRHARKKESLKGYFHLPFCLEPRKSKPRENEEGKSEGFQESGVVFTFPQIPRKFQIVGVIFCGSLLMTPEKVFLSHAVACFLFLIWDGGHQPKLTVANRQNQSTRERERDRERNRFD